VKPGGARRPYTAQSGEAGENAPKPMTAGTDGPGSGYAKFNYSDGFYEGNYVLKKHGMGRYVWSSTDDTDKFSKEYYGEWKDNKIHGLGAYTWPDGR